MITPELDTKAESYFRLPKQIATVYWINSKPTSDEVKRARTVTPPVFFSSPELAQGKLLGYRDVRRTCGRPRRPSVNFLASVHSRGNSFDPKFMKLCQNVNHHNI